ncbi:MAG: DUF5666 domain-containing protein [Pseudomonadota bacterium]
MKKLLTAILAMTCGLLISCGGGSSGFASLGSGSGGSGSTGGGGGGAGSGGGPGSGGTGVYSVFVGSVGGFGSIIVNGVHHDIATADISIEDGTTLELGMTTRVTGTSTDGLATTTATQVVSAADLRGTVSALNPGDGTDGTFEVMGILVTTDNSTVYATATGLTGLTGTSTLANGDNVQVHGLPGAPGTLRATRIERLAALPLPAPVVSGTVTGLDTASRTFVLGSLTVNFSAAAFSGGLTEATLANGQIVRVRALAAPAGGILQASQVQLWYAVPVTDGVPLGLAGIVTDFASLGSFKVMGTPVDASAATITGGPSGSIGNGVKLEITGTMSGGVLVATKVRIRHVPGTGGPANFDVTGAVGNYTSAASFRVQGQPIDASGPGVVFTNGAAGDLRNGVRVSVTGSKVVSGVLIADQVTFE